MQDRELLQQYITLGSNDAFSSLVSRYSDMVYSVAKRQVRDAHLAEDVAQGVFIVLARKAHRLGKEILLAGWLYRVTKYAAANALKHEARRVKHEARIREVAASAKEEEMWEELSPLLDQALNGLSEADRNVILLRFFQKQDFQTIGAAVGASENTVRMRCTRALEKMRAFFGSRRVEVPSEVLGALLLSKGVEAAPAVFAAKCMAAVSATMSDSAATAGHSNANLLAEEAMQMMLWAKIKAAAVVFAALCVVGLVVAGIPLVQAGEKESPPPTPKEAAVTGQIVFKDVSEELGIVNFRKVSKPEWPACPADEEYNYYHWPFNLLVGDFDNNGCPDLFCGQHGDCANGFSHLFMLDPKTNKFKIYRGDKVIKVEQGSKLGRGAYVGGVADINDDGLLDLVLTDGDTSGTLVRNVTRSPEEPKFEKKAAFFSGSGYAFSDLSKTGGLDTVTSSKFLCKGAGTDSPNLISGSGFIFEGKSHGNIWCADFNGDGWDDVLCAEFNLSPPGPKNDIKNKLRLFMNKGNMKFEEVTEAAGLSKAPPGNIAVADLTNHGAMDIAVLGSKENTDNPDGKFKIYRNDGNARFTDATPKLKLPLKLGWESDIRFNAVLADLDNDGFPDLVATAPYGYFRNKGDGTFEDFTPLPAKGTGGNGWVVAADFNNDGKLDLAMLSANPPVTVLRNETVSANKFLKLALNQKEKNVFAIGARIEIYRAGQLGEPKAQLALRELMCNNQNSVDYSPITIGVGPTSSVDLRVVFPNGKVVEKRGVAANQTLKIADTEATGAREFKVKDFQK